MERKIPRNEKLTKDLIEKYKHLVERTEECSFCKVNVSSMKLFILDNEIICMNCIVRRNITLSELNCDIYGNEHIEGEYRCPRLAHYRPLHEFITHSSRSGYKLENLCCNCRKTKRLEYFVRHEQRRNRNMHAED